MHCKIKRVIGDDTLVVYPKWIWGGETGSRIRPVPWKTRNYTDLSSSGEAKKLRRSLVGLTVILRAPFVGIDRGRLVCGASIGGTDIGNVFPKYEGHPWYSDD
jgi:hypothetical protein